MKLKLFPTLLMLMALAGCGKKDAVNSPETNPTKSPESSSANPAPGPAPIGPDANKRVMAEALEKSGLPGKDLVEKNAASSIRPIAPTKTEGWKTAKLSPSELGAKVDQAIKGLKGASGQAMTILDLPEGQGNLKMSFAIGDDKHYHLEYTLQATEADPHALIADGETQVEMHLRNVKKRRPIEETKPGGEVTRDQVVKDWPSQFTKLAFTPLTENRSVWAPLIGGLGAGQQGYATTIEERTYPLRGKDTLYYRIVAKQASSGTEIEILIDGNRFVPLTMKVNSRDAKGKESRQQWQAGWSFTRPIEPKEFAIPKGS